MLLSNRFFWSVLLVYTFVQLAYVTFFPLPFISDSLNYILFAQQAIQENTYYPNPSAVYNQWLVAPVYINYIVTLLKIYNGPSIILYCNILLNLVQLTLVYNLAKKFYNTTAAQIALL